MCWESYEQSEERIRAAELARQRAQETEEQESEREESDERVLVSAG